MVVRRTRSGDSDSAVRPSLPNSRSSSINGNGLSAPNSSQGNRTPAGGGGGGSNRSNANANGNVNGSSFRGNSYLPSQHPQQLGLGLGGGAAGGGINSSNNNSLDYGHDFFTGHWAESKTFLGSNSNSDGGNADDGGDGGGGTSEIFFVDGGNAVSPNGKRQQQHATARNKGEDVVVFVFVC